MQEITWKMTNFTNEYETLQRENDFPDYLKNYIGTIETNIRKEISKGLQNESRSN